MVTLTISLEDELAEALHTMAIREKPKRKRLGLQLAQWGSCRFRLQEKPV